jgi:hypothetical protein
MRIFSKSVFDFPIDTFLDKPVDRDTLLQHVDKLLK